MCEGLWQTQYEFGNKECGIQWTTSIGVFFTWGFIRVYFGDGGKKNSLKKKKTTTTTQPTPTTKNFTI